MASCGKMGTVVVAPQATSVETAIPLSGWIASLDCTSKLRGTLLLQRKTGAFGARLGIEVSNDGVTSTWMSIGSAPSYLSTVGVGGEITYAFDPNGNSGADGNISAYNFFKIVLLVKSQDANPSQGIVSTESPSFRRRLFRILHI